MKSTASIVWFRLDLRLSDNPALSAAATRGDPVIPVFIWAPHEEGDWAPGTASRWWLYHSLKSLAGELKSAGSELILRRGDSADVLLQLCHDTGATRVFWNRRYEPASVRRDKAVENTLKSAGIQVATFNSSLLFEPWTVTTQSGSPYKVFTAFWRGCLKALQPPEPLPRPPALSKPRIWPKSLHVDELGLWRGAAESERWNGTWRPGSVGAKAQLDCFLANNFQRYDETRDRPDLATTSKLSPHLHFGELGPGEVLHAVRKHAKHCGLPEKIWLYSRFITELGWREFAYHLLWHFPHTQDAPLRAEFQRFPWRADDTLLDAWEHARTGYPIVDAGMRELLLTGWMHNRVRMIVASFLVKDLLISWNAGAKWFWENLVDADLANNTLGWQWTAGCGADAMPFFRVFNPVMQGKKFDPQGSYVRKWIPELNKLGTRWIHQPWLAPTSELERSGITLGREYPFPIVDHRVARAAAIDAHSKLKNHSRTH